MGLSLTLVGSKRILLLLLHIVGEWRRSLRPTVTNRTCDRTNIILLLLYVYALQCGLHECKSEQNKDLGKSMNLIERSFCVWSPVPDALVSIVIDFDVAGVAGTAWKWPSIGK